MPIEDVISERESRDGSQSSSIHDYEATGYELTLELRIIIDREILSHTKSNSLFS